jgi:hypothetical protein
VKRHWIGAAAVAVGGVWMVVSASGAASANGQAPGGNNGTIKIEAGPPDDRKANEPHVSCNVYVEFWGYDSGSQRAELIFDAHAPTNGGTILRDTASWSTPQREGGRHLDHTYGPADLAGAFTRAGIAPAKQGWHVKLTVHVTGSKGSDVKHKVFWLEPCEGGSGSTSTTRPSTSTTKRATTTTTAPYPTTSSTVGAAAARFSSGSPGDAGTVAAPAGSPIDVGVLGGSVSAAGVSDGVPVLLSAPAVAGTTGATSAVETSRATGALPRTGVAVGGIALVGAGLIAGGALLRRSGRRLSLRSR